MVKDLITTMAHSDAALGLFVTLAAPTHPMVTTAAKEGFYRAANGKEFPRVQILTIEGLISGIQRPEFVDFGSGSGTFKKADPDANLPEQTPLL